MQRLLAAPVITHAVVSRFGVNFRNRATQFLGGSIRIASAPGASMTVTREFPNIKDRMHRSYQ